MLIEIRNTCEVMSQLGELNDHELFSTWLGLHDEPEPKNLRHMVEIEMVRRCEGENLEVYS